MTFNSEYRVDGSRVIVERDTTLAVREIPDTAFGEYAAVVSELDADAGQHFTIRGAAAATPVIPPDATSDEVYAAGQSAWDAKRYEAAAVLYRRATELAPKMGAAWIGLGLAENKLGKYDEAAAAIQKQIDLDPYNKRANGDLGYVLKTAGKTAEAINAYTRQVELNALDGSAFKELGLLYVGAKRHREAIPVLEKAAVLLPRDAWVRASLATAYFGTAATEKARAAIAAAMEIKPNAEVREYLAWHMAVNRVDLDRADELARGAAKDFTDELRAADLKTVTETTFNHVDRLAWAWDAIGWIEFQRGKLTEADAYVRAAWQLLGASDVAYHLGRICERRNKLADALSYYLTAQGLDDHSPAEVLEHVKKLAGGGDLRKMIDTARQMAPLERSFAIRFAASGTAQFLAVVDNTRKADVRWIAGSDAMKPFVEQPLQSVIFPILIPGDTPARLPLGVKVLCRENGECRGFVEYPSRVRLAPSADSSKED